MICSCAPPSGYEGMRSLVLRSRRRCESFFLRVAPHPPCGNGGTGGRRKRIAQSGRVTVSPPARVASEDMIGAASLRRKCTDPSAKQNWLPPLWRDQKWTAEQSSRKGHRRGEEQRFRISVATRPLTRSARPEELTVPQPFGPSARTHDDITSTLRIQDGKLHDLHLAGLLDFINSENFGYVKDRRHVAGFQSHRFSKVPDPTEGWRIETLDLVGLLLHKEPVAYVSANLPRMDELKKAPTRPLDRFETSALEKSANLRMLGAIRSAKQCVECHGGRRGDLLGAFSYTLVGGGK